MPFENTSLREYYLLRDRDSLSIDPWLDSGQFFGAHELNERL
jgi:hypothetical protein